MGSLLHWMETFRLDENNKKQFPLKLAYALTVRFSELPQASNIQPEALGHELGDPEDILKESVSNLQ